MFEALQGMALTSRDKSTFQAFAAPWGHLSRPVECCMGALCSLNGHGTLRGSKAPQGSYVTEVTAAERVTFHCDSPPEVQSPLHHGR